MGSLCTIFHLTRTGRNQEIFATKAQRHKGFYFVILSLWGGALVSWCLVAIRKKFYHKILKNYYLETKIYGVQS